MNMMNIIVEEIGPSDDLFYLDRDFNNMLNKLVDIVSNVDEQIINVAIVPDSSFIEYSVENFLKNQYSFIFLIITYSMYAFHSKTIKNFDNSLLLSISNLNE